MNIKKGCPVCGCRLKEIIIVERERGAVEEAEGKFHCSWCDTTFVITGKSSEDIHIKWNGLKQKAVQE